jgi:hypothetical protein
MKRLFLVLIVVFLAISACRWGADPAVVTATAAAETAAAASPTPLPPTSTNTPTPAPTATLTPTATPNRTATAVVKATQSAAPVVKELETLLGDIDIPYQKGHLAWQEKDSHDITLTEPGGIYDEIAKGIKADNFILKSDVTWNATGLVMCGAIFRSERNFETGAQYNFLFLRLSGMPGWDIEFLNYGQFKSNVTGKIRFASALNLDNGATNQFVLVAKENKFTVYINGVRQGQFTDDSKQASNGYLAFVASEDSGQSTCAFENSWLWILDK